MGIPERIAKLFTRLIMGIRKRFKSALFAFFKEEILKEVSTYYGKKDIQWSTYNPSFISEEKYKIVAIEKEVMVRDSNMHNIPFQYALDDAIRNTRRAVLEEAMKYVEINSKELFGSIDGSKVLKAKIYIGVKN